MLCEHKYAFPYKLENILNLFVKYINEITQNCSFTTVATSAQVEIVYLNKYIKKEKKLCATNT